MIKVGGIQNTQVLWQAVFLAALPLAFSGKAAKTFFRARLRFRQLRRLLVACASEVCFVGKHLKFVSSSANRTKGYPLDLVLY